MPTSAPASSTEPIGGSPRDVPVIPLYQVPLVYAYRADLRGIDPAPFDPFWNAENWWLDR